ncbi:hypothetical protein Aduo_016305 [Ancylostoma duodenale]
MTYSMRAEKHDNFYVHRARTLHVPAKRVFENAIGSTRRSRKRARVLRGGLGSVSPSEAPRMGNPGEATFQAP